MPFVLLACIFCISGTILLYVFFRCAASAILEFFSGLNEEASTSFSGNLVALSCWFDG